MNRAEETAEDILELIDEAGDSHGFRLQDVYDLDGVTYYLVELVEDFGSPPSSSPSLMGLAAGSGQTFLLKETAAGLELMGGDELEEAITRLQAEEPGFPSTPPIGDVSKELD